MASSLAQPEAPPDAPSFAVQLAPASTGNETPEWDDDNDVEVQRSLLFRTGGRVYACNVTQVREVVPMPPFTRIPGAPAATLGLINIRGAIVTVLDAGMLLHGRATERHGAMVLLVDVGPRGVGLAVERVADVRAVRIDEGYQRLDVREAVSRVVSITEEQ